MALIKCTECGRDVSDKASACPNCGCPIQKDESVFVSASGKVYRINDSNGGNVKDEEGEVFVSASGEKYRTGNSKRRNEDDSMNFVAIVVGVLVVLGIVIGILVWNANKKEDYYSAAQQRAELARAKQNKARRAEEERRSREERKRIEKANRQRAEANRQRAEEEAQSNAMWLYGTWIAEEQGYQIEMIVSENNLIQRIGGQTFYNGAYYYNGNDMLLYNKTSSGGWNDVWLVDIGKQALMHNGRPMRKTSGGGSSYASGGDSDNTLAEYDSKIQRYTSVMESAYRQFISDARSGRYTTITPPESYYELSRACTKVGAAAREAQRYCESNGNSAMAEQYRRIWERERQLYDSAYEILGNLH